MKRFLISAAVLLIGPVYVSLLFPGKPAEAQSYFGNIPGMERLGSTSLAAGATTTATVTIAVRKTLFIGVSIAGYAGGGDVASLRFNGDTGNNYWSRHITANTGAATLADNPTAATSAIRLGLATTQARVAWVVCGNVGVAHICRIDSAIGTGSTAVAQLNVAGAGAWNNTADITSVIMVAPGGANMNTGSGFVVYGSNF